MNRKVIVILASVAFIVALDYLFWGFTAIPVGKIHASADVLMNRYRINTYGLQEPQFRQKYQQLLNDKYDVQIDQTAGCIVQPWLFEYADAYNQVAKKKFAEKFSRDIFKECADEAHLFTLCNSSLGSY